MSITCLPVSTNSSLNQGDEIEVLNDTWLFILWSSDHSPFLSNSVCSRWPVAVIPKSLYLMDDATGVNLTVQEITREIVESFNRLSNDGIKVRDVPSMGGGIVTWFCLRYQYFLSLQHLIHPIFHPIHPGFSKGILSSLHRKK